MHAVNSPPESSSPMTVVRSMLSQSTALARPGSRSTNDKASELSVNTIAVGMPERRASATASSAVADASMSSPPANRAAFTP
jgi:hypothetical protein